MKIKSILLTTLAFLALTFNTYNSEAQKKKRRNSKPKTTYVKGYVKKNGTYVKPHYRKHK